MGKYDPAPTVAAGLLRTARDRAGLTQQQLADNAGLTQQTISSYETGRKEPTLPTLMRLLRAAGFEMRIHLERVDSHDESLVRFMSALSPQQQAEIDEDTRRRVEAARLRRVRGH